MCLGLFLSVVGEVENLLDLGFGCCTCRLPMLKKVRLPTWKKQRSLISSGWLG